MDSKIELKIAEYQHEGKEFLVHLKNKNYSYAEMMITLTLLENMLTFSMLNDKELKKQVIG